MKAYFSEIRSGRLRRRWVLSRRDGVTKKQVAAASHQIVTPFTGFVVCSHYVSNEIDKLGLNFLNDRAVQLNPRSTDSMPDPAIVYVQADQLEIFVRNYLKKIRVRFILITGKWFLPSLGESECMCELLSSPLLISWFTQNRTSGQRELLPFPYGVHLDDSPYLAKVMNQKINSQRKLQESALFIPAATVHPHLDASVRNIRSNLSLYASSWLPKEKYFDMIVNHGYVISPPGDRPDTYRHWETIALGSVPIVIKSEATSPMLSDSAVFVEDFLPVVQSEWAPPKISPNPSISSVKFWIDAIRKEIFKDR